MIGDVESLLNAALRVSTPLLFATLGEIYTEKSGVINLGLEGIMAMGALTAFSITLLTGNIIFGVIAATIIGGIMGFIHAFMSIALRANQIVSGLAITMLGLGISELIGRIHYTGVPLPQRLPIIPIPYLSNILIFGPLLFNHDPLTYLSLILAFAMWFILFKTKAGIIIRAVGENPFAADTIGINVYIVRYLCTVIGGMLTGLGGAYLSVVYRPAFQPGMTAGLGWIAVALTIFALWSPLRAIFGAALFGGLRALEFRLQPLGIPPNIVATLPYLFTIIVLTIGTRGIVRRIVEAPSSLGVPYVRGEK